MKVLAADQCPDKKVSSLPLIRRAKSVRLMDIVMKYLGEEASPSAADKASNAPPLAGGTTNSDATSTDTADDDLSASEGSATRSSPNTAPKRGRIGKAVAERNKKQKQQTAAARLQVFIDLFLFARRNML
jgi:hypothetical protein